jgi:hypothetical protein
MSTAPADSTATTATNWGKWLGLALVVSFGVGILVTALHASERYYDRRLVATDTSYFLMSVGLLLQGRHDFDTLHVLATPTPLLSSDHGTEVYVLHNLMTWILRAVLPLRPSAAVLLNSPWFLAMGASVYWLLWDRTKAWWLSALAAAAYLLANPYLSTPEFGLTSLDPNLHGYMIGSSALAWVLLSRSFRNRGASIVAGVFLGLLVLARVYTLGIVVPAMLPFVVRSVWTRSRPELRASLVGGGLAIAALLVVCGWWLFPNLALLRFYPVQFKSAGVLSRTDFSATALAWSHTFFSTFLRPNLPVLCVLAAVPVGALVSGLRSGERRFAQRARWSYIWLILAPLAILSFLGTQFGPYGTLALFGVYLTLLFPFEPPSLAILRHWAFAGALAAATAFRAFGMVSSIVEAHTSSRNKDRRAVDAALEAIGRHAAEAGQSRIKVGLVHWGVVHDASLIDAMIFNAGFRVATPTYPAEPRPGTPLIVEPLMIDVWVWDRRMHGDEAMTPERWAQTMTESADYVIVLAADASQRRRRRRWIPWVQTSRLLLHSPVFERITEPLPSNDGPLVVLARRR